MIRNLEVGRGGVLAICLLALFVAEPASSETSEAPQLRIENGMHTAPILRISIDAQARYLLTASDDKTARLWSLADGQLLRTYRVPLGAGDKGKLYSAALSPDARWVAVSGYTSPSGTHESIYLFDRASARMERRIEGMPNVVNHLSFSADGRYLAASLGAQNGIRVFDVANGREVFADKAYGDHSLWNEFDARGRLLSTSFDGFVRLYGSDFVLIAKFQGRGGKRPFSARFSPEGSLVAVGYYDSTAVDVLSGKDLEFLYAADTSGIDNGDLSKVAWSQDGQRLFAAGRYDEQGENPILVWDRAGRGAVQRWPGPQDTVMVLRALASGGMVYGSADPAWGLLDAAGSLKLGKRGEVADFRAIFEGSFGLSKDARQLSFGYEYGGKSVALFELDSRRLKFGAQANPNLKAPIIEGLPIEAWNQATEPRLAGRALSLEPYETSFSLALSPNRQDFALGTSWSLRRFDSNGKSIWRQAVPEVVWGVNWSEDGRIILAAHGDGALRWVRAEDGAEVLAFYPHPDRKRWVLWTPSGYFDASAGAEDLLGWHLNRGPDQSPDFFGLSRFREQFRRPDVIDRVLDTLDEKQALAQADAERGRQSAQLTIQQQLPPVVELLSPVDDSRFESGKLSVRYRLRNPSGAAIKGLKILIDGIEQQVSRASNPPDSASDHEGEVLVELPERDLVLALIAENLHAASEPVFARLHWAGQKPQQEFVIRPKLYVLAIGNSEYRDEDLRLDFPAKDAKDFVAAIETQRERGLYREIETRVLADASKSQVLEGLEWLERSTTSNDLAMLFMAGHGVNDNNGLYRFLPVDAEVAHLKTTAIAYDEIKNTLINLPGKRLLFLDTCFSGNVFGDTLRRGGQVDIIQIVNELITAENGVIVFTASSTRQYSLENPAWGNGAFTKALVEGLRGKALDYARDDSGRITIKMLDLYISERVKELTEGQQSPTTIKPTAIPDFAIAIGKKTG